MPTAAASPSAGTSHVPSRLPAEPGTARAHATRFASLTQHRRTDAQSWRDAHSPRLLRPAWPGSA